MSLQTIPPWNPPVTQTEVLNQQTLVSDQLLTVAGDNDLIPICFGHCQVPGRIVGLDYDLVSDTYTVCVLWCWGPIEAIVAVYANGEQIPTGITQTDYLGLPTQQADSTMAAANTGWTDTLVVTNEFGSRGLAYSVFQYTGAEFTGYPNFIAEIQGLKLYDAREGHIFSRNWLFTSVSYESKDKSLDSQGTAPEGLSWSRDGRFLITCDNTGTPSTEQYLARVPFEVQTLEHVSTVEFAGKDLQDVHLSPCGSYIFMLDTTANTIIRRSLLVPDDQTSGVTDAGSMTVNTDTTGFCFTPDRRTMYTCRSTGIVQRHTLSNANVISTGVTDNETLSLSAHSTNATGIQVKQTADADAIFVSSTAGSPTADSVIQYDLSDAPDLTGATRWNTVNVSSQAADPRGLVLSSGGSKLYVLDGTLNDIKQYHLDNAHLTWAYSDTPALALRLLITDGFFGPAQNVDPFGFNTLADFNEETVETGGEARRLIGLAIDRELTWESWRKILCTYASCWCFKRGDEWVVVGDRPATTDFTLTIDDMVPDKFNIILGGPEDIPTVQTVVFTDTTETIWRDRQAVSMLAGVREGTVERREQSVRLPGVHRYSQAKREADERLLKMQHHVEIEMVLYDEFVTIEPGDILDVTHPVGFTNTLFRVIAPPRESQVGRPRIRAIVYDQTNFRDTVETKDIGAVLSRYLGDNSESTPLATGDLSALDLVDQFYIDSLSTSQMETVHTTATTDLTSPIGTNVDVISDTIDLTGKLSDSETVLRLEGTVMIEWDDTANDIQPFSAQFWMDTLDTVVNRLTRTAVTIYSTGRDDSAGGTVYEGKVIFTLSEEFAVGTIKDTSQIEGVVTCGIRVRGFSGPSNSPDNADVTFASSTLHLLTR